MWSVFFSITHIFLVQFEMFQLSEKDLKINTNQFAVKLKKYLLAKSHSVSAIQKKISAQLNKKQNVMSKNHCQYITSKTLK